MTTFLTEKLPDLPNAPQPEPDRPIHLIRCFAPFTFCWKNVAFLDHYTELTPHEELYDCNACEANRVKEGGPKRDPKPRFFYDSHISNPLAPRRHSTTAS